MVISIQVIIALLEESKCAYGLLFTLDCVICEGFSAEAFGGTDVINAPGQIAIKTCR